VWRVHRAVGVGSDRIVEHLAGPDAERDRGDEVREHESEIFDSMKEGIEAVEGATEFVRALNEGGRSVVLASSGDEGDIEGFLDLLEIRDDVGGWVTSADVDQTKPHPDLIEAALERAGGAPAVMVGDTNWDIEAASRAGIDAIGVLSGGFPEEVLRGAGAVAVYDSVDHLRRELPDSPLG